MKRFLPIGIAALVVAGWVVFLLVQETRPVVDLSPYTTGQMQDFEVFDVPQELPAIPFYDREGREILFGDLSGKVLLINIWATWCEPCKEEMPTLVDLQERLGGNDFEVVTISVDWQGYEVMDEFFTEYGITSLTAYWDNSGLLPGQLEVIGLPLTILVDAEGRWIGRIDGPAEWNSADALALIRAATTKSD